MYCVKDNLAQKRWRAVLEHVSLARALRGFCTLARSSLGGCWVQLTLTP